MFDLELQSKHSPSFFSPDWLDKAKVELEWDRALFIWIDYFLSGRIFVSSSKLWDIYNSDLKISPGSVLELEGNDQEIAFQNWSKVSPKNTQQHLSLKYCQ